jgi:hypothetical protein
LLGAQPRKEHVVEFASAVLADRCRRRKIVGAAQVGSSNALMLLLVAAAGILVVDCAYQLEGIARDAKHA